MTWSAMPSMSSSGRTTIASSPLVVVAAGRQRGRRGDEQLAARREAELPRVADVAVVVDAEPGRQVEEGEIGRVRRAARHEHRAALGELQRSRQIAEGHERAAGRRRRGRLGGRRVGRRDGRRCLGRVGRRHGRRRARLRRAGGRRRRAAVERGRNAGDQLVDRDLLVAVRVEGPTREDARGAERDVHALDQLIDAHRPAAVTIAGTGARDGCGSATRNRNSRGAARRDIRTALLGFFATGRWGRAGPQQIEPIHPARGWQRTCHSGSGPQWLAQRILSDAGPPRRTGREVEVRKDPLGVLGTLASAAGFGQAVRGRKANHGLRGWRQRWQRGQ